MVNTGWFFSFFPQRSRQLHALARGVAVVRHAGQEVARTGAGVQHGHHRTGQCTPLFSRGIIAADDRRFAIHNFAELSRPRLKIHANYGT